MQNKLYNIILGPHVSEKSTICADANKQLVFKVKKDANKTDIKLAVEQLFNVTIVSVQTAKVKGKVKKFKGKKGNRSDWKKAYVKLSADQDIDFSGAI